MDKYLKPPFAKPPFRLSRPKSAAEPGYKTWESERTPKGQMVPFSRMYKGGVSHKEQERGGDGARTVSAMNGGGVG